MAQSSHFPEDRPAPHVLHVADREFFSRFGRMFRQLTIALEEDHIRSSLITDDAEAARSFDELPVRAYTVPALFGWRSWRLRPLLERRFSESPQLVQMWGVGGLHAMAEFAARRDVPLVVYVSQAAETHALVRRLLRARQHVVFACEGLAESGREPLQTVRATSRVTPPGLLLPKLPETERIGGTLSVAYVGPIAAQRGLGTLLDAVRLLLDQEQDVQAFFLGAGAVGDFWRRARQMKLQHHVTLLDEPTWWDLTLRGTDALVIPQRQDDLRLAPLLAMALSKVVIASRNQPAEWFVEDRNCWQFTPGSSRELAYQLGRIRSAPAEARELGRDARAYVRDNHTASGMAAGLASAYAQALGTLQVHE